MSHIKSFLHKDDSYQVFPHSHKKLASVILENGSKTVNTQPSGSYSCIFYKSFINELKMFPTYQYKAS